MASPMFRTKKTPNPLWFSLLPRELLSAVAAHARWNSAPDGVACALACHLPFEARKKGHCVICSERRGCVLPLRWRERFGASFDPKGETALCLECFRATVGGQLVLEPIGGILYSEGHKLARRRFDGLGFPVEGGTLVLFEDKPFLNLLSTDAGSAQYAPVKHGSFCVELVKK